MNARRRSDDDPPIGQMVRHATGLDAIRCAAALSVTLFHLSWGFAPLENLLPFGWVGVQVFFVLSGVVIANSALRTSPTTFAVHRFLRLYPAAWICTLIGVAAILLGEGLHATVGVGSEVGLRRVVSSLLLVGNSFVAPSFWTLPVEIAFYALVALVVAWRGPGALLPLAKGLILWSCAFLGLWAIGRAGMVAIGDIDLGYGLRNVTLLRHGHYFGLGILFLAFARAGGTGRSRLLPWIILALLAAGLEIGWRSEEFAHRMSHRLSLVSLFAGAYGTWLALCALVAASLAPEHRPGPSVRWPMLRLLGLATYPLYLLHESVGGALLGAIVAAGVRASSALILTLAALVALSLLIAGSLEPRLREAMRSRWPRLSPA